MGFEFEYVGARYDREWDAHFLFGRLLHGTVCLEDPIFVVTNSGPQEGSVSHFWDTLYDWVGMPFYHTVTPESVGAFCIMIHGLSAMPVCPEIACSQLERSP